MRDEIRPHARRLEFPPQTAPDHVMNDGALPVFGFKVRVRVRVRVRMGVRIRVRVRVGLYSGRVRVRSEDEG